RFKKESNLGDKPWIHQDKDILYQNGNEFIKGYDGTYPGTYEKKLYTTSWSWDSNSKTLTFSGGTFANNMKVSDIQQTLNGEEIENIIFTEPVKLSANSDYLFSSLEKLKTIEHIEYVNTSEVTSMVGMFQFDKCLTSLDLNKWNTSKVKNMNSLFYNTGSLLNIFIDKWDTSEVVNMGQLFWYSRVREIDLSNWDTAKVTNMNQAFDSISKITLGEKFRFKKESNLGDKPWIHQDKDILYQNGNEFIKGYDGTYPGTYEKNYIQPQIWEQYN
ncbi:BspA family leucine-rich repeat surface protein, partial [Carnobacterium maltaromaticum]